MTSSPRWTENIDPHRAVRLRAEYAAIRDEYAAIRDAAQERICQLDKHLDSLVVNRSDQFRGCVRWRVCVNEAGGEWRVVCRGCDELPMKEAGR